MSRLKPEKLSVEFRKRVTTTEPIIPRRYTLTQSDITADLFLNIGSLLFATDSQYNKIENWGTFSDYDIQNLIMKVNHL